MHAQTNMNGSHSITGSIGCLKVGVMKSENKGSESYVLPLTSTCLGNYRLSDLIY